MTAITALIMSTSCFKIDKNTNLNLHSSVVDGAITPSLIHDMVKSLDCYKFQSGFVRQGTSVGSKNVTLRVNKYGSVY